MGVDPDTVMFVGLVIMMLFGGCGLGLLANGLLNVPRALSLSLLGGYGLGALTLIVGATMVVA